MRIKFEVSYDGTEYCGWQRQKHMPMPSVQETLSKSLVQLLQVPIILFASGRTDAGVHAIRQICHFDLDESFRDKLKNWDLVWALRGILPPSITVTECWEAPEEFHSTLSAVRKTYKYRIYNNPLPSPLYRFQTQWVRYELNLDELNEGASYFKGHHDFKSFQSAGTPVKNTERHIYQASWKKKSPHIFEFSVTGSGFLKQMVRNMVGTQLRIQKRGQNPLEIAKILAAKDRTRGGSPAEPQGLFLWRVFYPNELDNKCRPLYTRGFSNWRQHENLYGKS